MHLLNTRNLMFMFWGNACGLYFIIQFGKFLREYGALLLLFAFAFMAVFFYLFIQLVRQLSKNVDTTYDIAYSSLGTKGVAIPLVYIFWDVCCICAYMTFAQTLLGYLGVTATLSYVICFTVLLVVFLKPVYLAELDFALNSLKFSLLVSFIVLGLYQVSTSPFHALHCPSFDLPQWKLSHIIGAFAFATIAFLGIEEMVNAKNESQKSSFQKAILWTPVFVTLTYFFVIGISCVLFSQSESKENLILCFFKNMNIPYIDVLMGFVFSCAVLGSMLVNIYAASRELSGIHRFHPSLRFLNKRQHGAPTFSCAIVLILVILAQVFLFYSEVSTDIMMDIMAMIVPCMYISCYLVKNKVKSNPRLFYFGVFAMLFFVTISIVQFLA